MRASSVSSRGRIAARARCSDGASRMLTHRPLAGMRTITANLPIVIPSGEYAACKDAAVHIRAPGAASLAFSV